MWSKEKTIELPLNITDPVLGGVANPEMTKNNLITADV